LDEEEEDDLILECGPSDDNLFPEAEPGAAVEEGEEGEEESEVDYAISNMSDEDELQDPDALDDESDFDELVDGVLLDDEDGGEDGVDGVDCVDVDRMDDYRMYGDDGVVVVDERQQETTETQWRDDGEEEVHAEETSESDDVDTDIKDIQEELIFLKVCVGVKTKRGGGSTGLFREHAVTFDVMSDSHNSLCLVWYRQRRSTSSNPWSLVGFIEKDEVQSIVNFGSTFAVICASKEGFRNVLTHESIRMDFVCPDPDICVCFVQAVHAWCGADSQIPT
jgi:hypothetical protein